MLAHRTSEMNTQTPPPHAACLRALEARAAWPAMLPYEGSTKPERSQRWRVLPRRLPITLALRVLRKVDLESKV